MARRKGQDAGAARQVALVVGIGMLGAGTLVGMFGHSIATAGVLGVAGAAAVAGWASGLKKK